MVGRPTALRTAAITRGKSVYPMMLTDCMKELEIESATNRKVQYREHSHVSTQQLDL